MLTAQSLDRGLIGCSEGQRHIVSAIVEMYFIVILCMFMIVKASMVSGVEVCNNIIIVVLLTSSLEKIFCIKQ